MNIDDQLGKNSTHKHQLATSHDRDRTLAATGKNAASANHSMSVNSEPDRVHELEVENMRLRKLVAELLVKNQQERELTRSALSASGSNERSNASSAWDKRDATRIFS